MADTSKSPCFLAKVEKLVANKATRFGKEDEAWLLQQPEEILDKLTPVEQDLKVHADSEQLLQVLKNTIKKPEDVLEYIPEEMKQPFQSGLKLHEEHRTQLISHILANSAEGAWTEDELKETSTPMLEKLDKQFKKEDYSANGGTVNTNKNQNEIAPLLPPGVKSE